MAARCGRGYLLDGYHCHRPDRAVVVVGYVSDTGEGEPVIPIVPCRSYFSSGGGLAAMCSLDAEICLPQSN